MPKRSQPVALPPNIRLTVKPNRLKIIYTNRRWVSGLFFLFWVMLWTYVCVSYTISELENGETWSLFFFAPFYLAWLFFLGIVARLYFHRETLRIDDGGFDWQLSAIVTVFHHRIPWDRLVAIQDGCYYGKKWYLLFVFLPRDASLTGCKLKIVAPLKTC